MSPIQSAPTRYEKSATEYSRVLFGYELVEGRQVVAAFDDGEMTSDSGALLLGATNRAINLVECFADGRAGAGRAPRRGPGGAAVFGIALGYED